MFPQIINPAGTITCGPTRLMFSFLDDQNAPVAKPDRTVQVKAFDLGADPAKPVADGAGLVHLGASSRRVGVYVADVDLPTAGTYGVEFMTAVAGGTTERSSGTSFDVQPTSSVVAVGDPAPPSETPTLADVGGDVSKISTDPQPVDGVLRDVGRRRRSPTTSRSCSPSRPRSSACRSSAARRSIASSRSPPATRT